MKIRYFDRDLSWLKFNQRVLDEASNPRAPLMERIKFLAIFSSNLDEFYRVRMPMLLKVLRGCNDFSAGNQESLYKTALKMINEHQVQFGNTLVNEILPNLRDQKIHLIYNEILPSALHPFLTDYFFNNLACFIEITYLENAGRFFLENSKLYITVLLESGQQTDVAFVNIPSDVTARFMSVEINSTLYLIFIDDVIRYCLPLIFPHEKVIGEYSIKVTRDAELDLQDEYEGDIVEKLEFQLSKRENGAATRLLYQPGLPTEVLNEIINRCLREVSSITVGGKYHNLKDLADLPIENDSFRYPQVCGIHMNISGNYLLDEILTGDKLVHPPYHSYDPVLRFFNEAAINPDVTEIFTTVYRVANNSKILRALMTAARNGKEVIVFIELKARFDEAHNIKWAKLMKVAGVKIIYSIPALKVHAKVALIKVRKNQQLMSIGLLATGNLNENTAKFYTDHVLFTARPTLLNELDQLFLFLKKRRHPSSEKIGFQHLLVAQFNLLQTFLNLIDHEIANVRAGFEARITIKINNLEEETLIEKLYEASNAGVNIDLIVRSVCRLVPGVEGMSANIRIRRIVDRYLEHGRIFIFHNGGAERVFLGSCDWMNRNIHRRIEVCFPLYDKALIAEVRSMIDLQLADNISAVQINSQLDNAAVSRGDVKIRSQESIFRLLSGHCKPG